MTNLVKSTTSSLVEVVNDLIDENVGMDGGIPFREAWADLLRSQSSVVCDVINNEGAMYSKFFVSTLITVISVGTGGAALLVPTTLLALASVGLAGSGWHFFNAVQLPKKARSQFLIDAFRSASVEEWEHLFLASGSVNLFAQAIEAGVVMQSESQTIYSGAAKYIKSSGGDVDVPVSYPSREAVTAICKVLLAKYHGSRYEELKDLLDKDILLSIEDCSYLSRNATVLSRELRMARVREVDYALFKDWVANVTPVVFTTPKSKAITGTKESLRPLLDLPDVEMELTEPEPIEIPALIPTSVAVAPSFVSSGLRSQELQDVEIEVDTIQERQKDLFLDPAAVLPSLVNSKIYTVLDLLIGFAFESYALIGGQRSGKTYLVSQHTQNVKKKHGTRVLYINLCDANHDAAEDWEHADICITAYIGKMEDQKARQVIESVINAIKLAREEQNLIIVFDEWVAFCGKTNGWNKKASQEASKAKQLGAIDGEYYEPEGIATSAINLMNLVASLAGELASFGKKQLTALWLAAPYLKAGDLEQQGLSMKVLHPIVAAIPPGRSIEWMHPVTKIVQTIVFDEAGYENSLPNLPIPKMDLIPSMDANRMAYIEGAWHSLDTLPAPSTIKPTTSRRVEESSRGFVGEGQSEVLYDSVAFDLGLSALATSAFDSDDEDEFNVTETRLAEIKALLELGKLDEAMEMISSHD